MVLFFKSGGVSLGKHQVAIRQVDAYGWLIGRNYHGQEREYMRKNCFQFTDVTMDHNVNF